MRGLSAEIGSASNTQSPFASRGALACERYFLPSLLDAVLDKTKAIGSLRNDLEALQSQIASSSHVLHDITSLQEGLRNDFPSLVDCAFDDPLSSAPSHYSDRNKDSAPDFSYLAGCSVGDDLSKEDKVINLFINKPCKLDDYSGVLGGLADYFKETLPDLVRFFNAQLDIGCKSWTQSEGLISEEILKDASLQS